MQEVIAIALIVQAVALFILLAIGSFFLAYLVIKRMIRQ